MNNPILMPHPPDYTPHLDSYASSSLGSNGQFAPASYGLAHPPQYQYPGQVDSSLNGAYTGSLGPPAPAFPAQQYANTNGTNGLEWDSSTSQIPANGYYSLDPTLHLKLQSLPMLDNLATQVIATFTRSSFPEIVNFVTRPESDKGQAYATVKALFDDTKRIYSRDHAFLSPALLGLHDIQQQDTIRKANLATFMSSIFAHSNDVNVYYLHNNFLDTFVPFGSRMLKWHAALFLELKTQAYISTVINGGMSREQMIQELFPPDMDGRLLARRPDAKQLVPSEQDFITRMNTRRFYLLAENSSHHNMALLARKYDWTDFLKELSSNISKNLDSSNSFTSRATYSSYPDAAAYKDSQVRSGSVQRSLQTEMPPPMHTPSRTSSIDTHDPIRNAALAAQGSLVDSSNATINNSNLQNTPSPASSDSRPRPPLMRSSSNPSSATGTPSPSLSESTHPLYPRARQSSNPIPTTTTTSSVATTSKTPTNRPTSTTKAPHTTTTNTTAAAAAATMMSTTPTTSSSTALPSPRRPWTADEETALLAGLDRVGGPHWSAILALYGAGGSVSEILKDRNQVQLKDKARNLKLWYLKSGREVPASLRGVTGELKTKDGRAGGGGGAAAAAAGMVGVGTVGTGIGAGGGVGGIWGEYGAAAGGGAAGGAGAAAQQERKQSSGSSMSEGSSSGKRPSSTPSLQQAKRPAR